MINRDSYRVILCYIDDTGEWKKTAMECYFERHDKSKQEALNEAADRAKDYLTGMAALTSEFMRRTVKKITGAYVEKSDYGAER